MGIGVAFAISAGISAIGNYFAAKEQSAALDSASAIQREQLALQEKQYALYESLIAEGKSIRKAMLAAGLETLPLLQGDINRAPGTGQPFKRALAKGTESIAAELSKYGLLDSSVTGRAVGEFTGELMARDIENIRNARFKLLSAGAVAQGPALSILGGGTSALQGIGRTRSSLAGLEVDKGSVTAGQYDSFGRTFAQLPLAYSSLGDGGGGGGGGSGGGGGGGSQYSLGGSEFTAEIDRTFGR